jgi:hypothetical protein
MNWKGTGRELMGTCCNGMRGVVEGLRAQYVLDERPHERVLDEYFTMLTPAALIGNYKGLVHAGYAHSTCLPKGHTKEYRTSPQQRTNARPRRH